MAQPTAFPRGKRKTAAAPSSSAGASGGQPAKKSRASSSSSSSSAKPPPAEKKKEKDFLFGNDAVDSALQKKSRSKSSAHHHDLDDDLEDAYEQQAVAVSSTLPLGGGAVLPPAQTSAGKRVPPKIEALTFSKFAKGTKVLGVIREVADDYAVVSLPTMLTGFVRRSAEGDGPPLTRVLPGADSIMAFYVLSTTTEDVTKKQQKANESRGGVPQATKKRRIELSPYPVHVNGGVRVDDYLSPPAGRGSSAGGGDDAPPMVVRGQIVSVEDHGCIVSLGSVLSSSPGRRAFLKFDNVEGEYEIDDDGDEESEDESDDDDGKDDEAKASKGGSSGGAGKRKLNAHRVYDFTILPSNVNGTDAIVQLGLPSNETLSRLRATPAMMPSLSSLQPGMLVPEVRVETFAKNGLCVAFNGGVYRGSLDEDHLGGHRGVDAGKGSGGRKSKADNRDGTSDPSMWWRGVFKGRHAKFTARIIAVDTATKIVRFSLNPHILALDGSRAAFPLAVGTIVKNAQVIRVDPGIGALLALPPAEGGSDGEGGEEFAQRIDKEMSNNLLSNREYRAASKVRTAYVHISKSMDNAEKDKKDKSKKGGGNSGGNGRTPESLFARHFSINTRIKSLRILSTSNLIDGIASCATARSIVDAHVLTHADIQPGKIYKDVPVLQLLDSGGVLVDLGVGTKGIVPASHLFDKASHGSADAAGEGITGYRSKVRQAKYKVGNKVTVRCLTVDAPARQCVLTAKKTLVSNDVDDPIVDYTSSIEPGRVAAGFISKVDDNGLTVTFYNNVYGRVSSRSLAAELGVEDPKTNYSVGDVVAARVVDCVRRRNRAAYRGNHDGEDDEEDMYYYQLKLSLKTIVEKKPVEEDKKKETADEKDASSASVPLTSGSLLMPKRMKVLQLVNCLHRDDGVFLPGYAVVSIKSKFLTGPGAVGDSVECKLPFDQLLDSYGEDDLSDPPKELDDIAKKHLTVGKRIDAEGLILSVPAGMDSLPIVSLRPSLIDTIRKSQGGASNGDLSIVCPSPKSNLFMGEYVRGYVARIDKRYGAFVRFLDGLSGLIPKLKKGLDEKLYDTILCKVTALDVTSSPTPKILLKKVTESEVAKKKKKNEAKSKGRAKGEDGAIHIGDVVGEVKVVDINFARAKVFVLDNSNSAKVRARIHVTMANALDKSKSKLSKKEKQFNEEHKIGKSHPFYNWKVGDVISGVRCVAVDDRDGVSYVELSNLADPLPSIVSDPSQLPPGSLLSAIVTCVSTSPSTHHGLWVQVCPGISGFIPALELSNDADVLNDLQSNYRVGTRITCCVMGGMGHSKHQRRPRLQKDDHDDTTKEEHQDLELSVLLVPNEANGNTQKPALKPTKPQRGDVVVGRINAKSRMVGPPSLMLSLRGNLAGRCCITELADADSWENMPLGKASPSPSAAGQAGEAAKEPSQQRVVSSDSDAHEEDDASDDEKEESNVDVQNDYPDGKYVKCIVLGGAKSKGTVELSMRDSRLEGKNVEDDSVPKPSEMVHAYVVSTTKMGCFVRLSRSVEGRIILKELSDDFIPNPGAMFPSGRLVVGKVKNIKETKKGKQSVTMVDMDMRESVLLASGDRITLDDIKENAKYTGVVTRVESYGVFVRIDNSDVSGLAHVSECSDTYIKNIHDLYNPGDFVKVIVINFDKEQKRLGFSLKASNFVDDDDSDDESGSESSSDEMDEGSDVEEEIDSEDEDFASKLAKKMESGEDGMDVDDEESTDGDDGSEGSSSGSESESSDSEDDEMEEDVEESKTESLGAMDTNVGFDWGGAASKQSKSTKLAESSDDDDSSSSESEDESDDDADSGFKSSHKARKKAAAKRREEEETSRREAALADGTADEAPETSADFERLVASSPNSSEVWIKYMAFHLSLADMDSARNVASRAFERIEFRQEGEKLNVWTALLTLELKYGTDKSLSETVDRACQQNNPKQVYLRVCELLDKEVDAAASASGSTDLDTATTRADEMFKKMCKKFKSKKKVWLSHFQYLLKGSRHEEAHALLKRSLQSLPAYKHVEVMSKFAQLEFELGSAERGRTIFNALLEKHPKRMDLLFVNIDKEVKNGDIAKARALFNSVVNPVSADRKFKFSDKQMKSLFKKWYRMEDEHGDEESQERVKEEARSFVSKTSA